MWCFSPEGDSSQLIYIVTYGFWERYKNKMPWVSEALLVAKGFLNSTASDGVE
jgi:hypothetical protein